MDCLASDSVVVDKTATDPVRLLEHRGEASAWRLLELSSDYPVEVSLGWGSSWGAWTEAKLTLSRGGRVCLLCSELRVSVRPLGTGTGTFKAQAALAPGFSETHNVFEAIGQVASGTPLDVPVPAMAQTVEVFPADLSALGSTTIQLQDEAGNVLSELGLQDIPDGGHRVGSAVSVVVSSTVTVPVQVVFHLPF